MKRRIRSSLVSVLILLGLMSQLQAQCPTVLWGDEFDAASLDLTKWSYQIGDGCQQGLCGWGNNELQYYQESNVTLSNGQLHITAKKEAVQGRSYTSGRIRTINKGDFTYGRFEARIKLPAGKGLWPAFWMLPTDEVYGGWPQSGELDIMEFVAADPTRVLGTIHYGSPFPNNKYTGAYFSLASGTFPDAFHNFAVEWEPGVIRWFVDDIIYSTKTTADLSPYPWRFDQNFHFLLNVAVGGNLGGPVDDNALPKVMDVDYVRVYSGFKPYISGKRGVLNQETNVTYTVGNVPNSQSVTWTVPAGATIVSGQGSPQVVVNFGYTGGSVTADFNTSCGTQQLVMPVFVEPPFTREFSFENFDQAAKATLNTFTGALSEVTNPSASGLNTSALVGRYVRSASSQYDVLAYNVNNIADANQYSSKSKKFYIDVYTGDAPVGSEILLQLETATATPSNYPTGRHSRYVGRISANNQWQRIAFELLDKPDGGASATGITKMILLFASNSFTGYTYHFDNLDSYASANVPTSMHVATVTTGSTPPDAGTKFGMATITIEDNNGNPVSNATVTGTFSGSLNETKSGVTSSTGSVTITTSGTLGETVEFCVTDVAHSLLAYTATSNVVTCSDDETVVATESLETTEPFIQAYPNPFPKGFDLMVVLAKAGVVTFFIYDAKGTLVQTISRRYPAGRSVVSFSDESTGSGQFLIKATIDGRQHVLRQVRER